MELTIEKVSIIMLSLEVRIEELKGRIECFEGAIKDGEQVERFTKALNSAQENLAKTQVLLKEMGDSIGTCVR